MKHNSWMFTLLVLLSFIGSAQDFTLKGRVLDVDGHPLPFASVLLKDMDSVLINGTATNEDGSFILPRVTGGKYLILASYIQNTSKTLSIDVQDNLDVGVLAILENAQELEGVTLTYEKPKLERKADRLIFNVENTALVDGNIWELLRATPSVNVLQGNLTVKNNSNVTILINGRRVNLPKSDLENLLSGSSASSVESIEVITNPPAKYSAEDGILIDIKMSKNLVAGYNGAIFNRYRQGVFPKHTLGTDHFFKGKKVDFSVNYSFSKEKNLLRYTDITNFLENGNTTSVWTANQDRIERLDRHNINVFFDYTINDRNTLSLSSINTFNPKINTTDDSETLVSEALAPPFSRFTSTNASTTENRNTSFYADWTHKPLKKGSELTVGTHYTHYKRDNTQDLQNDFFDASDMLNGENDFFIRSDQKIALYSAQIDYTLPLSEATTMETGLRYAGINSENGIAQEGFNREQPGIDPTENGIFDYDEDTYAAYVSFDSKWNKWRLRYGLRGEQTKTLGKLDTQASGRDNSYFELFPSLSAQYTLNEGNDFTFQYYRRIERPRYRSINPFQYFQSNFTVVEGNPDLLPAINTRFSIGYTFKNAYTLELIYDHFENKINEQAFQDNSSKLLRFISVNLENSYSYGFDFTFNKDLTKFWNSYVLIAYFYQNDTFKDLDTGLFLDNDVHTWIARTNQSFTLLKDRSLYADLTFFYISPTVWGNKRNQSFNRLGIYLRKNVLKNAGSLSIGLSDIFNQGNMFSTRKFLDQDNSTFTRQENRLFALGFRYKFGNTKIRDNYKRKNVDERDRI